MLTVVDDARPALEALCRRHRVKRLALFGSAVTTEFDEAHSDLDFLVSFGEPGDEGPFRQYIDLLLALEQLFGRRVDLVEEEAIGNPVFREAVAHSARDLLVT